VRDAIGARLGDLPMDHPIGAADMAGLLDSVRGHLEGDWQAPASSGGGSSAGAQLPPARAVLVDDISAMAVASGDQLEGLTAEFREILLSEPFREALADVVGSGLKALSEQLAALLRKGPADADAHAARALAPSQTRAAFLARLRLAHTGKDAPSVPPRSAARDARAQGGALDATDPRRPPRRHRRRARHGLGADGG
jgi:hypothetical protein